MTIEPNAGDRLRRMCGSTRDLRLREQLRLALGDESAPVPSAALACEIAACAYCDASGGGPGPLDRDALCSTHRARVNLELCLTSAASEATGGTETTASVAYLEELMRRALTSDGVGIRFLSAFHAQARAIDAVWEAYRRGAIRLPKSVADALEGARLEAPGILTGNRRGEGDERDSPRLSEVSA